MRIMAFGDIHFHHTHRFSTITSEGFTTRELEHLSCADTLINLYNKEKIDVIVCLGDVYGPVGDAISAQTQKAVLEFFNKFNELSIKMSCILGNHDIVQNNLSIHKLEPIKYMTNIDLIERPKVIVNKECNFVFMPYCIHDEEAIQFLENIKDKQNSIIFSHLELSGINLGNGLFTQKGVPLDLLNEFKMTLQGHYHSGNSYGSKIQIAGSTQRLSFKDKGISRNNILIYDTETNKIERRSFTCPDWLTFTDENIDDILKIDNNNYVKVELSTDILLTDEIKAKINQFKDKDLHIDLTRISVNKQISDDTVSTEDNIDIIRKFVNKSDNTEDKKEELIQEGTRLLNKVV